MGSNTSERAAVGTPITRSMAELEVAFNSEGTDWEVPQKGVRKATEVVNMR